MSNIVIATSRYLGSASATASTEASASTSVGNLLTRDPSARWRVDDLSAEQWAQISLGAPERVNFAALCGLRSTQTTQNFLRSNAALDGANWTKANVTAAAGSTTDPRGFSSSFDLTATGVSVEHYVLQSTYWTIEGTARLCAVIWARRVAGTANLALRMDDGVGPFVRVYVDLGSGAVNSSETGGGFTGTLVTTDVTADGDWYRCSIVAEFPRTSTRVIRWIVYVTDSSHATSYTAGSEEIEVAYPMLTLVREGFESDDIPDEPESNGTTRAAVGWFEFDDGSGTKTFSPLLYAGTSAGRQLPHRRLSGRIMAWKSPSLIPCSWTRAYVDDPDNALGYFEAARLLIDRAWQPPGNYLPGAGHSPVSNVIGRETESGAEYRRDSPTYNTFSGILDFETEREMYGYLMAQAEHTGLSGDVVVIPNPESAYYDSQAVWGYWQQLPAITHVVSRIWQAQIGVKAIGGS